MCLAHAQGLVSTAIEQAQTQGQKIAVVVVDGGGHPICSARMDGVGYAALDAAQGKARAAAAFGAPTTLLSDMAAKDPVMERAINAAPGLVTVPGGIPIAIENGQIWGLGIAGIHYRQDADLAEGLMQLCQPR